MAEERTGDKDLLKMLKMFNVSPERPKSKKDLLVEKEIKKFADKINKRSGSAMNKGGMAKKKTGYAAGGMPMVKKDGKKVPAFAADGVGKMNKGGMAKKKPAAKMMAGGMAKKKK